MDIHKVYLVFQKISRPRRMKEFYELFGITPDTRVLDVGGTLLNWTFMEVRPTLTILNVTPPPAGRDPDIEWIVADARSMPFEDKSFDVVFSNSVIEHVGSWEDQKKFAEEIRRVARRYFVQTPNYWFPIEPHFITPFIHWFPRSVSKKLLKCTLRYLITRDSPEVTRIFEEVRLLKPREMRELFPDASIRYEKVLGIPKSIYAIKR